MAVHDALERTSLLLCAALAATACASCSGPQPLAVAIDPKDDAAYLTQINAVNLDGKQAFARWMAEERGALVEQIIEADGRLGATRNPFDANKDHRAVSRGAVMYKYHCARCHGDDARGLGPSIIPGHPAGNFRGFAKRFAVTLHRGAPKTWFRKITEGHGEELPYPDAPSRAMPAFGEKLTREQIWLVITYLQSLDMYAAARGDGVRQ